MIHPKWHEYAMIAFREMVASSFWDGEEDAKDAYVNICTESGHLADAMCAEYDKRNGSAATSPPKVSAETTARLAALKGGG